MLLKLQRAISATSRHFSVSSKKNFKVTLLGAAGGVGQNLALLLKANQLITKLNLHDVSPIVAGVAVDLSHIETPLKLESFVGPDQLCIAMADADIIIVATNCGPPPDPKKPRGELLKMNVGTVKHIMRLIAKVAPKAFIAIITNPINSIIPAAAKVLEKAGCFDPKRLFGLTTIDIVRANTFIAEEKNLNPLQIAVPVVGGHSETTTIPLLSRVVPKMCFTNRQAEKIIHRVRYSPREVLEKKAGLGSITLAMAYAGARFTNSLLKALKGEEIIIDTAYVMSDVVCVPFFASPLALGKTGIIKNLGLGEISCEEQVLLKAALIDLQKDIDVGLAHGICPPDGLEGACPTLKEEEPKKDDKKKVCPEKKKKAPERVCPCPKKKPEKKKICPEKKPEPPKKKEECPKKKEECPKKKEECPKKKEECPKKKEECPKKKEECPKKKEECPKKKEECPKNKEECPKKKEECPKKKEECPEKKKEEKKNICDDMKKKADPCDLEKK